MTNSFDPGEYRRQLEADERRNLTADQWRDLIRCAYPEWNEATLDRFMEAWEQTGDANLARATAERAE